MEVSQISILTLKKDLRILGEKLNSTSKRRSLLEEINLNAVSPICLVPSVIISRLTKKERSLTVDYLCLEQLIHDMEFPNNGDSYENDWSL